MTHASVADVLKGKFAVGTSLTVKGLIMVSKGGAANMIEPDALSTNTFYGGGTTNLVLKPSA